VPRMPFSSHARFAIRGAVMWLTCESRFGAGASATATEMQNNFGRYLGIVMAGDEVVVTRNGKPVGRLVPQGAAVSYLTDPLTGILRESVDLDRAREEGLEEKYAPAR